MNRALPFLTLLAALMSACGSTSTPSVGTGAPVPAPVAAVAAPAPVASAPLGVGVTAAVLGSAGNGSASLRVSMLGGASISAQSLSVSVDSVPAGVTLALQAPTSGPDGVTMGVNVQASGTVQGDAVLSVRVGGQVQQVRLPLLRANAVTLPAAGGAAQVGATAACGGDVLLSAPVNAPLEQRSRLLRLNPATGTVTALPLGLSETEGVTSQLCGADGTPWMTVRSDGAQGSVIAHLNAAGKLERFAVGAVQDTLNNLTRTADGRLWFVQYKRDRLGEFDPRTGAVTTHDVAENAENLHVGQDGALYYSQFYANPAVVRYDPATGGSAVMPVGASGKSLPRASVQVGGSVWYVDAWMQTVSRMDLQTRQVSVVTLPTGAVPGEMVAAPDGTVWVADAARHVLYRFAAGQADAVTVPLLGGSTDGPRALGVDGAGRLWYESAGQMVGQQ